MEQINRLQTNLSLIRRTLGWSTEQLGSEIGVTRQTINNIERSKTIMTKTQYLAIRSVMAAKILEKKEEYSIASDLLTVLVDDYDLYTTEQRNSVRKRAELIADAIGNDEVDSTDISDAWKVLVGIAVGTAIGVTATKWIDNILEK